ncbi:hypothetical protein J2S09_002959 [Bacillus fengqiuensis]|nr:hypothetical protein [Bacillus fengqiuensis]
MFDPIVFDNLKVVIEGEVYDLDLEGHVSVVNREDYVDLARFSRVYRISFQQTSAIVASLLLTTHIDHIHAELSGNKQVKPGCLIEIDFVLSQMSTFTDVQCANYEKQLRAIWGEERIIEQRVSHLIGTNEYKNEMKIKFNRYIYEDQVDDIIEMVDYMLETIQKFNNGDG